MIRQFLDEHFPFTTFTIRNKNEVEVLKLWVIFYCDRFSIHLHRISAADSADCYHSHPAEAFRVILWGGYAEENLTLPDWLRSVKRWWPGMCGRVHTLTIHRIHRVKRSWSLWFRSNVLSSIYLFGNGWDENESCTVIREPTWFG